MNARACPPVVAAAGGPGGREDVPPCQPLLAQTRRLGAEVAREERQRIAHGREEGLQGGAIDARAIDGGMQAVGATAAPVQRDGKAFHPVHACRKGLAQLLPLLHLPLVGAAAHLLFRVAAQVDETGHGERAPLTVQVEVNDDLGGQGALQLAPGICRGEGERGGEHLLGAAHEEGALRRRLRQGERVRGGGSLPGVERGGKRRTE